MADEIFHTIEAEGVTATLDLRAGQLRRFEIRRNGTAINPTHTAPWVDDPAITGDESLLGNLRFLSGDFFCAPFCASDVEEAPSHGWPANTAWRLVGVTSHPAGGQTARYELARPVLGARLFKEFTVRDGHPFLYQRHVFVGGAGELPVASHGMTRFDKPGRLSFSNKLYGTTLETPLEPDPALGRYALAYPAHFTDVTKVPTRDGGTADITRYPYASRNEDFVMLVEDPANPLGWTAAVRPDKRDIYLSLKLASDFPVTMLWTSNGGRDYAPWNSRHVGVQGVEEGRSYAAYGHKASVAKNPLSESGVPTTLVLDPDGEAEVRHVIGGLPLPEGWSRVASVVAGDGRLTATDEGGGRLDVPFDAGFLKHG